MNATALSTGVQTVQCSLCSGVIGFLFVFRAYSHKPKSCGFNCSGLSSNFLSLISIRAFLISLINLFASSLSLEVLFRCAILFVHLAII